MEEENKREVLFKPSFKNWKEFLMGMFLTFLLLISIIELRDKYFVNAIDVVSNDPVEITWLDNGSAKVRTEFKKIVYMDGKYKNICIIGIVNDSKFRSTDWDYNESIVMLDWMPRNITHFGKSFGDLEICVEVGDRTGGYVTNFYAEINVVEKDSTPYNLTFDVLTKRNRKPIITPIQEINGTYIYG